MNFVRLCTVDSSLEANFIKEDLAEAGIPCIATNENFTTLMPHMNGMLGAGVQILVHKDDLEAAQKTLEKRYSRDVTKCPDCGSTNIKFGLGIKRKTRKVLALAVSLIIGSPTRHIKQTYYCDDCKNEFSR